MSDRLQLEKLPNCEQYHCLTHDALDRLDEPRLTDAVAYRVRRDEGTVFLGDGSLAAAPTPKLNQRGIRSVIKVVDDRCL